MLAARRAAASLRRAPLRSFAAQTKATYNWADPMNLNAQLTEDERMFRDSAHAFCQQELQPTILKVRTRIAFGTGGPPPRQAAGSSRSHLTPLLQANRNEHFDAGLMKKMGEQGLLGATLQGYGCAGVNYVTCAPPTAQIETQSPLSSSSSLTAAMQSIPITHSFSPPCRYGLIAREVERVDSGYRSAAARDACSA
jgi:glutaryl-CoA dehydrogenase